MDPAARASSYRVVRTKRPRREAQIDTEAAARAQSSSHIRGVKPRRRRTTTGQVIPSHRAKKTRTLLSPLRPSPDSSAQIPSRRDSKKHLRAVSRAQIPSRWCLSDGELKKQLRAVSCAQISSRRCLDDISKQQLPAVYRTQISSSVHDSNWQEDNDYWGAKRARTDRRRCCPPLPPLNNDTNWRRHLTNLDDGWCFSWFTDLPCPPDKNTWRDWANLDDGPAGLIAERVLAYDVADYVRFRAVCRPWRQCSTEPRSHSGLDRRFHPWRWTMLREELAAPDRRCFLNTSTCECVKVDIPELHDHKLLALTPEGLLVLVHDRKYIRLLNPLTRHITEFPPLTTLLPPKDHHSLLERTSYFNTYFPAWGSGVADDDSTFVLCLNKLSMLGMAKPGDRHWKVLRYDKDRMTTAPVMIAGRLYCITNSAIEMLTLSDLEMPHLKVAAKLKNMHITPMADTLHLVNNCGELMLLHRHSGPLTASNDSCWAYDMYQVDLGTRTLVPVKSLGGAGRALFIGMRSSLCVSLDVFPSGSVSADTIYPSFDFSERDQLDVGAYHLADGSVEVPCSLVAPHTLVECLSLSNTVSR